MCARLSLCVCRFKFCTTTKKSDCLMLNEMIKALQKETSRCAIANVNEVHTQLNSIAIEVENMSPPRNHLLLTYSDERIYVIHTHTAHFSHVYVRVLLFVCIGIYAINIKVHSALKPINSCTVHFSLAFQIVTNYIWYLNCHMKDTWQSVLFSSAFKNRLQLYK